MEYYDLWISYIFVFRMGLMRSIGAVDIRGAMWTYFQGLPPTLSLPWPLLYRGLKSICIVLVKLSIQFTERHAFTLHVSRYECAFGKWDCVVVCI